MNAIIAEKEQSEVVEFRAPGPGERLRNARLAQDMDIGKVAERIHLTADMVDALECDDYSELPARVFVRGYVRNYARLVELPVDSVVAQFDELWPEDKAPVKIESAPRLATDTRPGNHWTGAITWLLLIGGIVLFLMWWQGYLDRFTERQSSAPATLLEPEQAAAPVAQSAGTLALPMGAPAEDSAPEVAPQQGPGLLALPPAPAPVSVTREPVAPLANQPGASAQPAAALVEQGVLEPSSAAAAESQPAAPLAAAPASEPAPPVETPVEPAQPTLHQGVVVRFSDDCWVDIRDSDRSFKLFGTMRKGTERQLEGKPPYKFVLGNAAAVNVSVNGKPFDLAAHTRDNVARFSLSP